MCDINDKICEAMKVADPDHVKFHISRVTQSPISFTFWYKTDGRGITFIATPMGYLYTVKSWDYEVLEDPLPDRHINKCLTNDIDVSRFLNDTVYYDWDSDLKNDDKSRENSITLIKLDTEHVGVKRNGCLTTKILSKRRCCTKKE